MKQIFTQTIHVPTIEGLFILSYTTLGLVSLAFPFTPALKLKKFKFTPKNSLEKDFYADLNNYFLGKVISWNYPLDLSAHTPFQKEVWQALQKISYGKIKTYKEIAIKLNRPRSFRAVGNACSKNPLPIIIPCHRVVKKNYNLGGFSSGLIWKEKLLRIEKSNDRILNLNNYSFSKSS